MKVYVTQYAFTDGVTIEEVERTTNVSTVVKRSAVSRICIFKPNWHETREEAVERVAVMREKKIRSLEKQLRKLQALDPEKMVPQEEQK